MFPHHSTLGALFNDLLTSRNTRLSTTAKPEEAQEPSPNAPNLHTANSKQMHEGNGEKVVISKYLSLTHIMAPHQQQPQTLSVTGQEEPLRQLLTMVQSIKADTEAGVKTVNTHKALFKIHGRTVSEPRSTVCTDEAIGTNQLIEVQCTVLLHPNTTSSCKP